ncbi:MAG: zinc ABC transporter substrate-binding protein, partial [Thermomicrobiales bacterium]|nr:zinc ABC transporter substrate-binding protein [Thermomicrobiales bacterium]
RMSDRFAKIGQSGNPTSPIGERVPAERLREAPEFPGAYDPHIWFDVESWMLAADVVAEELIAFDPTSEAIYLDNLASYRSELDDLHHEVQDKIDSIPADRRVLVTAHDAFGYFGREYGLEVIGLQGTSTATEASANDVRVLADLIAERKIPAIFIESSVSPATISAVREAVRARGFDVVIGGQLFSDALGDDGTPEGTYLGMVRHNVDAIVAALSASPVAAAAA